MPVAIVRGFPAPRRREDGPGAAGAWCGTHEDMFSLGTAEARAAGMADAARLPNYDRSRSGTERGQVTLADTAPGTGGLAEAPAGVPLSSPRRCVSS